MKTSQDIAREFGAIFTESVDLVCFSYPLLDTFATKIIEHDRAQRQDAETWSLYIASMVEAYLQSKPAADKREAAIAGIISRRLWALPDRAQGVKL